MSTRLRTPRDRAPQSENPQLGDLSFDDWYETPVFEAEPDERLEQLATSRRAPLRFFAGAVLRVAAGRPRRERRAESPVETEDPIPSPLRSSPGSWRDRTDRFLDRWAAMETASQQRLEALVLPKRWRG